MSGIPWSDEELRSVRELYPKTKSWRKLLLQFPGRSKASVRNKVISLGIKREVNSRTPWLGSEKTILRDMWPTSTQAEICAAIPRHPYSAISKQANSMKLRRLTAQKRKARYKILRDMREFRLKSGISRNYVADRLGTHPVQISKWEGGYTVPKFASFLDWVDALGLQIQLTR